MRSLPLVFALGIAALTATPLAVASANGCAAYSPGIAFSPTTPVPGPYPNSFGAACGGGLLFTSTTGACPWPATAPSAQAGQYCGATAGVLTGATVTCTAWSPGAVFRGLVVGLDETNTGNVGTLSAIVPVQIAYDGPFPSSVHTVTITNTGLPAMLIAYPVVVPSYLGPIIMDCA